DIPGQIQWSDDDLTMGFTPSQKLPLGAHLQANLDAAAETAGGVTLGAAYTVLFDTVKPPAVVSTSPSDGDQSADSHPAFRSVFSAPRDVTTLEPNIDIEPKPPQVYTSWSDNDLSFFIGWDLQPSADYTVTLNAGMKDPYGNAIAQAQTVKFHTAPLAPQSFFNAQGQVVTYNAYSDTVLSISSINVRTDKVALYNLYLEEFAALTGPDGYNAGQSYKPAKADLLRSWSVNPPSAVNETVLTKVPVVAEKGGALPPGLYYLRLTSPGIDGEQDQILVVS